MKTINEWYKEVKVMDDEDGITINFDDEVETSQHLINLMYVEADRITPEHCKEMFDDSYRVYGKMMYMDDNVLDTITFYLLEKFHTLNQEEIYEIFSVAEEVALKLINDYLKTK